MAQEVDSITRKREKPQLQVFGTSWSQIHFSNQFYIFDMRLVYHQLLRTLIFHQPGPSCDHKLYTIPIVIIYAQLYFHDIRRHGEKAQKR